MIKLGLPSGGTIGGYVGGGTANCVLYIDSSGKLACNANFRFNTIANNDSLVLTRSGGVTTFSYARIVTDSNILAIPTSPTGASGSETVDGNGNYSSQTVYYKIYGYYKPNGEYKYSASSTITSIAYSAGFNSGDVTWSAASGVTGYVVFRSFDGLFYTSGYDNGNSTSLNDSADIVWDFAFDIEDGDPPSPTFSCQYAYFPAIGGTNYYSVYGQSGYFSWNLGCNVYDPQYRLHVQETNSAKSAAAVFRGYSDGGFVTKSVVEIQNDAAVKVISLGGANLTGAGDYGQINFHGTATVSYNGYSFGDFNWVNNSGEATGDLRMGTMRVYRDGTAYQGTWSVVLRNGSGSFISAQTQKYSGQFGLINVTNPTAWLHLPAGTATASTAPLKFTSGTLNTTGETGAIEYNSSRLTFIPSGTTRKRFALTNDVTPSNGQIPIGNGTDFTAATLTAGTNISITNGAGSITINASGGGGSGNSVTAACDFGASFTDKAQTVVTGQAWVTSTSEIVAQVLTPSGVDPDELRLLDMKAVISDLVVGTGFTVTLYSEAEAKGAYDVMCIGV